VETEGVFEWPCEVGRNGEEVDFARCLLVEGGFEVGDEDADEATEFAADRAQFVVYGADASGEVFVDSCEEVAIIINQD
jgi:hypothetical protein